MVVTTKLSYEEIINASDKQTHRMGAVGIWFAVGILSLFWIIGMML